MSELTNIYNRRAIYRHLLSTASALALIASSYTANVAQASDSDADRPVVWIELGGDFEHVEGQGKGFAPAFLAENPNSPVFTPISPLQAQNPPPFSFGEEGAISFQPENSDWIFSAAVRFGRSSSVKEVDHQTNKFHYFKYHSGRPTGPADNIRGTADFADTHVRRQESHTIVDFSAGKDVGLGLFGNETSSVLSLGVRFAQFASKTTVDMRARPDLHVKYTTNHTAFPFVLTLPFLYFHAYHATGQATRSFQGVGPSLSWNGSVPFIGHSQSGEATLDWGVNAALLFGRQKAAVQHQESGNYRAPLCQIQDCAYFHGPTYQNPIRGHKTMRSLIVPDAGGFAGISFRYAEAKLSLGYRGDFFFNAMDEGIDMRKSGNIGFYGPFATISIGLSG